jgi:hypothetical protein
MLNDPLLNIHVGSPRSQPQSKSTALSVLRARQRTPPTILPHYSYIPPSLEKLYNE